MVSPTVDEAPAKVKNAARKLADCYDRLVAEHAATVESSLRQDALQTLIGYTVTDCYE